MPTINEIKAELTRLEIAFPEDAKKSALKDILAAAENTSADPAAPPDDGAEEATLPVEFDQPETEETATHIVVDGRRFRKKVPTGNDARLHAMNASNKAARLALKQKAEDEALAAVIETLKARGYKVTPPEG